MTRVHLLQRDCGRVIGTADRFQATNRRQPGPKRKNVLLLRDVTLPRGSMVTLDADLADQLVDRILAAPTGD